MNHVGLHKKFFRTDKTQIFVDMPAACLFHRQNSGYLLEIPFRKFALGISVSCWGVWLETCIFSYKESPLGIPLQMSLGIDPSYLGSNKHDKLDEEQLGRKTSFLQLFYTLKPWSVSNNNPLSHSIFSGRFLLGTRCWVAWTLECLRRATHK